MASVIGKILVTKKHGTLDSILLKVCFCKKEKKIMNSYLSWFVVKITVFKHKIEVFNTFLAAPVIVVFKTFLDGTHIHRLFDNLEIVG